MVVWLMVLDKQFYTVIILDKPAGYTVFSQRETVHYKNSRKSALITITFYLDDYNHEEVSFNGKTLTPTLELVKIQFQSFYISFQKYITNS